MSRRRITTKAAIRARSRGMAVVEVLVIAAVVLVLGLLAVTIIGRTSSEQAEKEANCIKSMSSCGSGVAQNGGAQTLASEVGTPGSAGTPGTATASPSKGFWGATGDVAKGFFVDGLWGTAKGLGNMVLHPIDTAAGVGHVVMHPIDSAVAIKDGLKTAWNENPQRLIGAGVFEIITLPLAPAKAAKVETVVSVAAAAKKVDRTTDVVAAAPKVERVTDKPTDVAKSAGQVASKLGDLRPEEIAQIQKAANELRHDIYVTGSAARGQRRGVGSDLPLAGFGEGKKGTKSDIDYAVKSGHDDVADKLNLPDKDKSFGVRGVDYINLDKGPVIRFRPGQPPEVITGQGKLPL